MQWFKQSTTASLIVGPILDSTGAEYNSAVIGDISLSKNGGTLTALASTATLTNIANGQYTLALRTTDLDTLGRVDITCNKVTYQMPPVRLTVLQATVFDALITNAAGGANGLVLSLASNQVNVGQFLGSATPVTNLNTVYNTDFATVYDATNKAYLAKLGNFAMGGSSLALTTGAISATTLSTSGTTTLNALTVTNATTLSGAVSLGSTLGVTGTTTFAAINTGAIGTGNFTITGTLSTSGTTTFNALTVTNALTVSGATTLTGAVTGTNASNDLRINGAVPGAAGGLFIAGTNAATTVTTSFTTTFTGNLTGSVGSITGNVGGNVVGSVASVTGNVGGNVVGSVASVTGNVGGNVTGSVGSVVGAVGSVTGNVGGNVTGSVGSVVGAVGSVTGNVGGNVTGSVGSVVAAVSLSAGDSPVLQSGTATAGGATSITIQTALGADSLPVGCLIKITSGTGIGQARIITAYVNSTKVVTVDRAWVTNPDATSVYSILYNEIPKLDSSLKVAGVVLTDTITTYTGNTPQTGDSFARIGSTGSGLTSLAPASTALSTAVWTAPPTGFLAATFPSGTIASTTNITAGTITTATNVTTVNGLANNVITAASVATDAATEIAGAVWDVALASHLTAGSTGFALNAAGSAGDPWGTALPGAYGAGTAGFLVGTYLDAAVGSRMATYTQPTGFLAATFPTTVASTTNITAGTITTVTNLTNAPTSGDFTATMKTSLNASTPASITGAVGSVTGNVGGNVVGSVASVSGNVGGNVVGSVASVVGNVGGNVVGSVASVAGNVGGNVLGSIGSVGIGGILYNSFASNSGIGPISTGTVQSATSTTVVLDNADVTGSSYLNNCLIRITSGAGVRQVRNIVSYDALTRTATISPPWIDNPDNSSSYATLPNSSVLDQVLSGHVVSGTAGAAISATNTSVTSTGVVVASGSKTGYTLAAAGLDSVVVESGLNMRQAQSIIASAVAGVLAGAATTTITVAAAGVPATNRVTATVDANGNRSAVTITPPS